MEIRKDEVALFDAPLFFRVAAVGMTAQLQRGSGIPYNEDLKIPEKPFPPRDFFILSVEINTCINPDRKRPSTRKGAADIRYDHVSVKKFIATI